MWEPRATARRNSKSEGGNYILTRGSTKKNVGFCFHATHARHFRSEKSRTEIQLTNTSSAAAANSAICLRMNARGGGVAMAAFCATDMTASNMIREMAASDAVAASGSATCQATIKGIMSVLNGRTQRAASAAVDLIAR